MKLSINLFLISIGAVSAFVAPGVNQKYSPRMAKKDNFGGVEVPVTPVQFVVKEGGFDNDLQTDIEQPAPTTPMQSRSIPFLTVPSFMDGSMAGDIGFDPMGFSDSKENMINYREAEIKHARLAMLAAAGWPLSELFDKKIADLFGMEAVVDAGNRVPSVLNGGMGKISPLYWIGCIFLAGGIDAWGYFGARKKDGYFPGDLGFDPFGLYPKDEKGRLWMQTAEIKNGRLAMIAITAFCFQEAVSHIAVVDQTPFFFKPIFETLLNNADSGYIMPEEIVQQAASTASSAADTMAAATGEAVTAVSPAEIVPDAPTLDAILTPPVTSDATSLPMVDAILDLPKPVESAPVVPDDELAAAKQRIVELEDKIASITKLMN